jgi:hypothetical protein
LTGPCQFPVQKLLADINRAGIATVLALLPRQRA